MLRVLQETGGTALAVDEGAILTAVDELARHGWWISPEGAALLPAVRQLRAANWLRSGEQVVLLNTGTGFLYPEVAAPGLR